MPGARVAILSHGIVAEIGSFHLGFADELASFSAEAYQRAFAIVAGPLTLRDDDVAAVMDEVDVEVVARLRRERTWFPEREFGLFLEGWVAVPIRLHDMQLAARRLGPGPDDSDLFSLFSNAVASFESFSFAVYCAASMLDPRSFPTRGLADLRKVSPRSTITALERVHPSADLTRQLRRVTNAPDYRLVGDLRNTLSHRASPVSLTEREAASKWPVRWLTGYHIGQDVELNAELVDHLANWVSTELGELVVAFEAFARDRWTARGYALRSSG